MHARLSIILVAAALSIMGCSKSPAQKEEEALIGSLYGWDEGKVKDLQLALMYAGYSIESVDGIIGPGTREQIAKFQRENGLNVSKIIDPDTWAKLRTHSPRLTAEK